LHGEDREIEKMARLFTHKQIPKRLLALIKSQARGEYQEDLIAGSARWSGSDLTGTARTYAARYSRSRDNLVERIDKALKRNDWRGAETRLIRLKGNSRHTRELVLISLKGTVYVW